MGDVSQYLNDITENSYDKCYYEIERIIGKKKKYIYIYKERLTCRINSNLLTTIPQSSALTITPQGHHPKNTVITNLFTCNQSFKIEVSVHITSVLDPRDKLVVLWKEYLSYPSNQIAGWPDCPSSKRSYHVSKESPKGNS